MMGIFGGSGFKAFTGQKDEDKAPEGSDPDDTSILSVRPTTFTWFQVLIATFGQG
jgi:hypothetical protein